MAAYRRVYDSVTCRLTAKNRDQLRNPTLGNRVWARFTFFICAHTVDCCGCMSVPLQRVTSLRRRVQANAAAASYRLRRVVDAGGRRDWASASCEECRGRRCERTQVRITPLRYSLGHGLRTFTAVPRSTQPSTLRVK